MIECSYEGTRRLAKMQTVEHWLRNQWITMQALEDLAPGNL